MHIDFTMNSVAYLGVVFMKRSIVKGLLLALCLLPVAAGATEGGVPDRNEDRGIQFKQIVKNYIAAHTHKLP